MQALLGPMISSPFRYEELDAFVAFSTLLKFLHRLLAAALTFRAVEVCLIGTIWQPRPFDDWVHGVRHLLHRADVHELKWQANGDRLPPTWALFSAARYV